MITGIVRFSYANVWEPAETPSGTMKYSVSILIEKTDKDTLGAYEKAVQDAVTKGLDKNVFGKAHVKGLRLPLRDGDTEHEEGRRGPEYQGFYFLNASSNKAPGIVGPDAKPIMDQVDFYSGCWGRADINFFPYSQAGNRGIGVGLNNLMKIHDGDRLDGRRKAEDAFAEYSVEDVGGDASADGDEPPF